MECVDIFCLGKETFLLGVGLEAFFHEIKKKTYFSNEGLCC
jgi:hypothetical protein